MEPTSPAPRLRCVGTTRLGLRFSELAKQRAYGTDIEEPHKTPALYTAPKSPTGPSYCTVQLNAARRKSRRGGLVLVSQGKMQIALGCH